MKNTPLAAPLAEFFVRLGAPGKTLDEGPVCELPFADGTTLLLECLDERLLVALILPERHPGAQAMGRLLSVADCRHGWPLPLAAGLTGDDARALLLTWLPHEGLDCRALETALQVLQKALASR
jgi:type III secretion system chaperone SycN